MGTGRVIRADAARNAEQIRHAALTVFASGGLGVAMDEVAALAGVSKATVYNRFGGRAGLVDTVLDELIAAEMLAVVDASNQLPGAWDRIEHYVTEQRGLQYLKPAAIDVLLNPVPGSVRLSALCQACAATCVALVDDGHSAGVLRTDFTPDDLYDLFVTSGLALKYGHRPAPDDFRRRTRFLLDGMRPTASEGHS